MTLITDQLRLAADKFPDEVGFSVVGAGDLTLSDWHRQSSRFGRGLMDRGVQPGDRVALVMAPADGLRFVVAYAAAHKAGAVAVPVNVRMSPGEVAGVLRHCEPTVVVTSSSLRSLVDPVDLPHVVSTDAAEWTTLLHDDDTDLQVARDTHDLAEILYTSGTTGTPKGVAIRHSNSALFLLNEHLDWNGRPWIHASPMFTMAGLTFVYQPMRMGMRTLYQPKFDVAEWLRLVREQRPQACFLVPSMVELLLASPEIEKADLSSLELVSVGAAPVAPTTLLRLQKLVPEATVTNSYSMTEAGTAYFIMPKGQLETHPGSVGQPIPPAEVRIVDDDGKEAAQGDVGNVQVKPAGKTREYYKNPEATAETFRSDGWLATGDLGRFDDDGYLYIVGRAKDMIIRGGFNIYASDVEAALYEHPAVQEAAVVGVPHNVLGEDVAAYVVLSGEASPDELIVHCKERLADYKVPRSVQVVDELPRNATGKVLKRQLIEQHATR